MKKSLILLATMILTGMATAAPVTKKATNNKTGVKKPAENKTAIKAFTEQLDLNSFLQRALAANPTIRKIRATYTESRKLSQKTAAIRDLTLTAGTAWDWYNKVFSSGSLSASDSHNWSLYATLSKRFPKLLGMDASLSFTHNSSTSSSGTSHTPNLSLTLSIPLLKNFLGKVDRNDLKKMDLAVKIADRAEQEAYESLLLTLHYAYIDWALAAQKAAIYRGTMNRSAVLLNQTLRKRRLGIADTADLALARQNYLSWKAKHLTAVSDSSSRYLDLMAQMAGGNHKKEKQNQTRFTPVMDWAAPKTAPVAVSLSDLRSLQMARLNLEDARLALNSALSSLKPDLNLIVKGGTGSSKTGFGTSFSSLDQNNLYTGMELTLPLQNTEQKKAKQAARAAFKKMEAEYKELQITVSYTLASLKKSIETGTAALKVQKLVVTASLIRLNAFYRKYRQGRVSMDRVTDARDAYANQQIAYIEKSAALKKLQLQYASLADRLTSVFPLRNK